MYIPKRVDHITFRGAYGELGILAYERKQSHYIAVSKRLSLAFCIAKNHSLVSTTVQEIGNINRSMLNYWMVFQFRMMWSNVSVELTFPHYLYGVTNTVFLLYSHHRLLVSLG